MDIEKREWISTYANGLELWEEAPGCMMRIEGVSGGEPPCRIISMREADRDLYEGLPGGEVKCHVCEISCVIQDGQRGFCKTRLNRSGILYSLIYGATSGVCADPIEKKPLYHFYPGSLVLSAGARGCNFRCPGCQNWHISHDLPEEDLKNMLPFSPGDCVASALESRCRGIAWTYNDPSIWFEQTYDTARLAKAEGLYTVYVTNGYSTARALEKIAPWLDAFRVDIKAFSRRSYRRISGIGKWETIPKLTEKARCEYGMHVEAVTNVTPGINDSAQELRDMAEWIHGALGPDTPWHVTRFFPHLELSSLSPTPMATLERAYEIGLQAGLRYVYLGNVAGHKGQDTHCPNCGWTVIQRMGYQVSCKGMSMGKCCHCGTAIAGVWDGAPESNGFSRRRP